MDKSIKWWLFFCIIVLFTFISWYFNIFALLYVSDITMLSWFIILLTYVYSITIGYKIHTQSKDQLQIINYDVEWYVSEMVISMGMVGTVVGFIYMLSLSFTTLDINEISSLQSALGDMALGMGTALWTTLIGLICSILLKVQLIIAGDS